MASSTKREASKRIADDRLKGYMPKAQEAETKIKLAVILAFFLLKSEWQLRLELAYIVKKAVEAMPGQPELGKALEASADRWVRLFYNKEKKIFLKRREKAIAENKPFPMKPKDLWAEAKGTPYIGDYAERVKRRMELLAKEPAMTREEGKRPISIWQKAELDVRAEHQERMIEGLKEGGSDLCYISSHPNCSERCEPWQGKLVSLSEHSKYSGFRVRKVDGEWVYSLTDIMAQKDKYGYHNNVICGFNCRHRLIPYTGQNKPKGYTDGDVSKQRKVEAHIRSTEREIRRLGQLWRMEKESGDPSWREVKAKQRELIEGYKAFCERHGYAWEPYRIKAL